MLVDQDDSGNSFGNQNRCSTARVPVFMLCALIFCAAGLLIERKVVLPSAAVAVRAVLQPV